MSADVTPDIDSPNLSSLDRWRFEVRKVEKPWGHELIWALSEPYCGKVLFVKAGAALSLQFHREKEESWLVQSGKAKLELGEVGQAVLSEEVIGPGDAFHYRPGTVHRVTAIEDTDHPRGLDAAPRRRRPARGSVRPRGDVRRVA